MIKKINKKYKYRKKNMSMRSYDLHSYLKIFWIVICLKILRTSADMDCSEVDSINIIPNFYNSLLKKLDKIPDIIYFYEKNHKKYSIFYKNNTSKNHEYYEYNNNVLTKNFKNEYDLFLKSNVQRLTSNKKFYIKNQHFLNCIKIYISELSENSNNKNYIDILSVDNFYDLINNFELFDFPIFVFENQTEFYDLNLGILNIYKLFKKVFKFFSLAKRKPNFSVSKCDFDLVYMRIENIKTITKYIFSKINLQKYEIMGRRKTFNSFVKLINFIQKVEFYCKALNFKYFEEDFKVKNFLLPIFKTQTILLFNYEWLVSNDITSLDNE